jgi:hypothetical protein
MGKMGLFTIHFANSSKIFYPGQDVQGEVQLQVKDEVKIRGKISSKLIQVYTRMLILKKAYIVYNILATTDTSGVYII